MFKPLIARIELLWEIPLAVLSFLFSRLLKFGLTQLSGYYTAAPSQKTQQWQLGTAEFIKGPLKLLWVMSRARWNLHAIIAIAGPLEVTSDICLDVHAANRSAKSWTVVAYTLKNYQTITSLSSLSISGQNQWESLSLKPGQYLLGLRYYHWSDTLELPAVKVNGNLVVPSQTLAATPDFNGFYRDLINRKTILHVWLNYYVFDLLQFKNWLPKSFVETVFLPVPNPETHFYYGGLRTGEALHFDLNPSLLSTHDVYFSLYSRDCFPLDWYQVRHSDYTTAAADHKSLYVIRVHQKSPQDSDFVRDWVKLTIIS